MKLVRVSWDSGRNICDPKKKVYKKHWRDYKNTKGSSWLPECEASKNIADRCAYYDKEYEKELQRLRNFEDSIRPKRWWRGGKTKNRKTKKSQIRKKKTRHKKKTKNAKERKVKKKGSKKLKGGQKD